MTLTIFVGCALFFSGLALGMALMTQRREDYGASGIFGGIAFGLMFLTWWAQ